jgi:hypothetical protein
VAPEGEQAGAHAAQHTAVCVVLAGRVGHGAVRLHSVHAVTVCSGSGRMQGGVNKWVGVVCGRGVDGKRVVAGQPTGKGEEGAVQGAPDKRQCAGRGSLGADWRERRPPPRLDGSTCSQAAQCRLAKQAAGRSHGLEYTPGSSSMHHTGPRQRPQLGCSAVRSPAAKQCVLGATRQAPAAPPAV